MLLSRRIFDDSFRVGELYIDKRNFQQVFPEFYISIRGLLTDEERYKIATWMREGRTTVPKELLGLEYSAIGINSISSKITVISDISGKHLIYYNHDELIVGFEFWEVCYLSGKRAENINPLGLKRQLIFASDVTNGTFISGIDVIPNASIAYFSPGEKPVLTRYWRFKKQKNNKNFNDKKDSFLEVLDRNVKRAYHLFGSPKQISVGLSGGLDSRLIPWLCARQGVATSPFIICDPKPNKFFDANDLAKSRLLSNIFGVELDILNINKFNYRDSVLLDAIQAPLCSSQIFKFPSDDAIKKIKFMLTGASGYIVGSSPFYGSPEELDLINTVFRRQSVLKIRPPYHKIKRGLNYLLSADFNIEEKIVSELPGVMSRVENETFFNEIFNYFSDFHDVDDTDKLMNYAIGVLGRRNYSGGFESLSKRVDSVSIYDSSVILEVQNWSNEDIYNRKFFEDFLHSVAPHLVKIRGQDYKVSIANRGNGIAAKIKSVGELAIRGQGVMNYESWIKGSKFKTAYKELLRDNCNIGAWIDMDAVENSVISGKIHPSIITDLLKLNVMIGFFSDFPHKISSIREIRSKYGNK